MIKVYNYNGKNKEELLKECLLELNCGENDILIKIEESSQKLFKSKKYQFTIVKKEDIKNFIKNFVKELGQKMNLEINVEITEQHEIFNVLIVSNNNPIIIGKEGRTLNALQTILKNSLINNINMPINMTLDVSNYKKKKMKSFEYEIKMIAEEVEKTGIEVKLDSMNSYNRRLVHTIVTDYPSLVTQSCGEEPDRYVIISKREDF